MDVLLLILDWVLDSTIVGGFTFVCAMPFVALLALLGEELTRTARANDRKRWYRETLKRTCGTTREEREDWGILRTSPRKRVFLAARVVLDTSGPTLDATVIDLSDTGARLAFGRTIDLPKASELDIGVLKTGERAYARVAWTAANQCGVAFTGTPRTIVPLLTAAAEIIRDAA